MSKKLKPRRPRAKYISQPLYPLEYGSVAHRWKETGLLEGPAEAVEAFAKNLSKTKVQRDELWPQHATHEMGVAVDPLNESLLFAGESRDRLQYMDDAWCTGCVDTYWFDYGELCIEELKTGHELQPNKCKSQMMGYAVGLSRALDYDGPVHFRVTHWPRGSCLPPIRYAETVPYSEVAQFESDLAARKAELLTLESIACFHESG